MSGKRSYGWLFPLVLAGALGGLSAWLDRISAVTVEETALNPNEPQYLMEGIAGIAISCEVSMRGDAASGSPFVRFQYQEGSPFA